MHPDALISVTSDGPIRSGRFALHGMGLQNCRRERRGEGSTGSLDSTPDTWPGRSPARPRPLASIRSFRNRHGGRTAVERDGVGVASCSPAPTLAAAKPSTASRESLHAPEIGRRIISSTVFLATSINTVAVRELASQFPPHRTAPDPRAELVAAGSATTDRFSR